MLHNNEKTHGTHIHHMLKNMSRAYRIGIWRVTALLLYYYYTWYILSYATARYSHTGPATYSLFYCTAENKPRIYTATACYWRQRCRGVVSRAVIAADSNYVHTPYIARLRLAVT